MPENEWPPQLAGESSRVPFLKAGILPENVLGEGFAVNTVTAVGDRLFYAIYFTFIDICLGVNGTLEARHRLGLVAQRNTIAARGCFVGATCFAGVWARCLGLNFSAVCGVVNSAFAEIWINNHGIRFPGISSDKLSNFRCLVLLSADLPEL